MHNCNNKSSFEANNTKDSHYLVLFLMRFWSNNDFSCLRISSISFLGYTIEPPFLLLWITWMTTFNWTLLPCVVFMRRLEGQVLYFDFLHLLVRLLKHCLSFQLFVVEWRIVKAPFIVLIDGDWKNYRKLFSLSGNSAMQYLFSFKYVCLSLFLRLFSFVIFIPIHD